MLFSEWGYSGANGPDTWKNLPGGEACGSTVRQSPIDIDTDHVEYDPALASLTMKGYDIPVNITLMNNGHTRKFMNTV